MIEYLPYDIRWKIVTYLDDLDLRRKYKIYRRINLKNFEILNRVTRYKYDLRFGELDFNRYYFYKNIEEIEGRYNNIYLPLAELFYDYNYFTGNIENDMVDITFEYTKSYFKLKLFIFKLRKKPHKNFVYSNSLGVDFHVGDEDDYYWQFIEIEKIIK